MFFMKINALGNDFVFWGSPSQTILPDKAEIRFACDRKYGIGADCAVFISQSYVADYAMHVYNPDGFEAEMCGNALRCSAQYVIERGFFKKRTFNVETNSGERSVFDNNGFITAEIGKAVVIEKDVLTVAGIHLGYRLISVGNPHCVIFTESPIGSEFDYLGPAIEHHEHFPSGVNVEFVNAIGENEINMRVWERGIGETLSCVTGSCASVAAVVDEYGSSGIFKVHQPGGIITVDRRECGRMLVSGRCSTVFKGETINNQEKS